MNGQLAFEPYPSTKMGDAVAVQAVNSTLALLRSDPRIQTQLPETDASGQWKYRASQTGDVLSRQPGGTWEARPTGATGAYEDFAVNGALAVYCPDGDTAEGFLYWSAVPNV
jgi:hypothetical protein